MFLTSENIQNFVAENSETVTGLEMLQTLGFRTSRNTMTFGCISRTPTYGARILRMLGVQLNKGVNAKLEKMKFNFLECEIFGKIDFSEFDYIGDVESSFTVYKAYELDKYIALKADNGCYALVNIA